MTAAGIDDHRGDADAPTGKDDVRFWISPPATSLLKEPLEFILEEHLRQRQAAKILCLIADGVVNRRTIEAAADFIRHDLALHILDEELSLFPALRVSCLPEDNIGQLLDILAVDHREDERLSGEVRRILSALLAGESLADADAVNLRAFADHLRRHIALENGVLLPLAAARLDVDAIALLSTSMVERRPKKNGA